MQRPKPQSLQNYHLGSNIKFAKEEPKTTIQPDYSCCMEKTAPRNNEYSKNEVISVKN